MRLRTGNQFLPNGREIRQPGRGQMAVLQDDPIATFSGLGYHLFGDRALTLAKRQGLQHNKKNKCQAKKKTHGNGKIVGVKTQARNKSWEIMESVLLGEMGHPTTNPPTLSGPLRVC